MNKKAEAVLTHNLMVVAYGTMVVAREKFSLPLQNFTALPIFIHRDTKSFFVSYTCVMEKFDEHCLVT
jgi:hypothetical protein